MAYDKWTWAADAFCVDESTVRQELQASLRFLSGDPRRKQMVLMRFGIGGYSEHTYEQIGEVFNLTGHAVSNNMTRAFEIMATGRNHNSMANGKAL